jgi:dienelactone hydrolase
MSFIRAVVGASCHRKGDTAMQTRDVAYTVGGKSFTGYLARPDDAASRPGVLVCHQGGGVTEHTRERARMLAEAGYIAFALDMYGEAFTTIERAMVLMNGVLADPAEMRRRAQAALDVLESQPAVDAGRLAAIGYCFGGALVLEMARSVPALKGVVSFHPGMAGPVALPEKDDRPVHAKVLVCAGADDPLIPPEAREHFVRLMTAVRADWQLIVFGGVVHSFTDRSVDAMGRADFKYDARADRRSWVAMRAFLDELFN